MSEAAQQQILADGLAGVYFQDRGRRAAGLSVELTDLGWLDVEGPSDSFRPLRVADNVS
nr:hypothetical protein [Streptomyces sp. TLI_235]